MMENSSSYFSNRACAYFPCHPGADPENFNCLFCYCPLYVLGSRCGGSCTWTADGRKDCTACLFPHKAENYRAVLERYAQIAEIIRQNEEASPGGKIVPSGS